MITPKSDCGDCNGCGLHGGQTCKCVRVQELAVRIRQAVGKHGKLFERVSLVTPKRAFESALVSGRRARGECLLVRADWPSFVRQLLCVVVAESVRDMTQFSNEFPIKVTSDLKIRQDYFAPGGGIHLRQVEGAELVVIRLGLSAKNAANAPSLYEVMMMADDNGTPVWLVETASKPFETGHPSWSQDLEDVIAPWPRVNLATEGNDPAAVDVSDLLSATEVE